MRIERLQDLESREISRIIQMFQLEAIFLDNGLETYWQNTQMPWGILFYRLVWAQLPNLTASRILDFGSGFGITASHLAKHNDVTAIEPNQEMVHMSVQENEYRQITGGLDKLRQLDSDSFDCVVCHNVLEYVDERETIIKELCRTVKSKGILSIIKHNHAGRIMQKVVFENNMDQARSLLDGESIQVMNFGQVHYYDRDDLSKWLMNQNVTVESVFGLRTFFALQQNNDIKFEPNWQDKMFELEMKVSHLDPYRKISFFNHLLLRKS